MSKSEVSGRAASATVSCAWYVLQVHARRERWVSNWLIREGYEVCLPLRSSFRQWSDRNQRIESPVFSGYVFCKFDILQRTSILQTPGVLSILGNKGQAIPLELAELQALQVLERAKVEVLPWPFLKAGDCVMIAGGPLDGLVGILENYKKSARVVVSIGLLQRSVAVEIERSAVKPINPRKRGPSSATAGTREASTLNSKIKQ